MPRVPGRNPPPPLDLRWQAKAACAGAGSELFFPEDVWDPKKFPEEYQAAVEYTATEFCAVCPVRGECYEHSIQLKEGGGIWGGVDVVERMKRVTGS